MGTEYHRWHADFDMSADPFLDALYEDPSEVDGYFRDACVYREDIDIPDTMTATIRYANQVAVSYSLNTFMPIEGYTIAFNGTLGRIETRLFELRALARMGGHFADRLRGGAPFVQPWPRQERGLLLAERLELQQLLARRGFYQGAPDGQMGGQTREALRSFQASIGAPADGFASADMLERLRGH